MSLATKSTAIDETARRAASNQHLRNVMTGLGTSALAILGIYHAVHERWDLLAQVAFSAVILAVFIASSKKLHQDVVSYFFVILTAILHNLGLYGTHPFGIRFDHYTHFLGAFSVATVVDRFYLETLSLPKRFLLLVLSAFGVGAVVEILQWADAYLIPGIRLFQADDISNSMVDMIYNGVGGIAMGLVAILRKAKINSAM